MRCRPKTLTLFGDGRIDSQAPGLIYKKKVFILIAQSSLGLLELEEGV